MKKVIFGVMLFAMVLGITACADAVPLTVGSFGFPTAGGVASPGVGLLASLSIPFTGMDAQNKVWFTGTLNQWVRNSAIGLVFEYQLINNPTSAAAITLMDTTVYNPFTTNVDTNAAGVSPLFFSRPFPGAAISFNYALGINPGATSDLMWIQTNATSYALGTTQLQGTGNTRLDTYAPAPEPGSMALLSLGLLGFAGALRRKFMA